MAELAKTKVRGFHPEDLPELIERMRKPDWDEVEAAHGEVPGALASSIQASTVVWSAEVEGRLACVFGCAPISGVLGRSAAPWMLGTHVVDQNPGALMRLTPAYIGLMRESYPHLLNYVDARNTRSVRWLRRMGFEIHPAQPYGVAQLPFHLFEMKR